MLGLFVLGEFVQVEVSVELVVFAVLVEFLVGSWLRALAGCTLVLVSRFEGFLLKSEKLEVLKDTGSVGVRSMKTDSTGIGWRGFVGSEAVDSGTDSVGTDSADTDLAGTDFVGTDSVAIDFARETRFSEIGYGTGFVGSGTDFAGTDSVETGSDTDSAFDTGCY